MVDPQSAYPKAGTDAHDSNGGQNLQVVRGKLLWLASDSMKATFAADWSHQNQSAIPNTDTLAIPNALFSGIYNLCISTPVARLNSLSMQNQGDLAYIGSFETHFPVIFQVCQTTNIFNTTHSPCWPRDTNPPLPFSRGCPLHA